MADHEADAERIYMGWDDDMRNLTLDCFLLTLKYVKHQYEVRKLPNTKDLEYRNFQQQKKVFFLFNKACRFFHENFINSFKQQKTVFFHNELRAGLGNF